MASKEGEDPRMSFKAMTEEFLKMKKMVEELTLKVQGGAKKLVKVEE
jgi:hypothetical protein